MNARELSRRDVMKGAAAGAAAIAVGGILAACGSTSGGTSAAVKPRSGGNLRVGVSGGGSTETLDPFFPLLNADVLRCALLYSYVGEIDGKYQTKGLLAESVAMADKKGEVWDVRLRQGAEFHDGKPVTADDLIWTYRYMLDPKTQASGAQLLPWVDRNQIKKLDQRTARFTLTQPVSTFETALFNFLGTVVPANFDAKKPVGAGPFKFKSFSPGDRSVFTKFENYFGHPAFVDQVEVISFKELAPLTNALQAGDLDIAMSVGSANAAVAQAGGASLVTTPGLGFQPLTMRTDVKPFDDPRVREAFRLIVDREQVVEQVYAGHGAVANDLYGWDEKSYAAQLPQREQDIEKAKALLQQAGVAGLSIDLPTTNYLPGQVEIAEVFAEQAKAAGVKVNVINADADTFFSKYYLQASFATDSFVNVPYLNNTLQSQLPSSPYNGSHFNDPEFTKLYAQVLATTVVPEQEAIEKKMQQIQYDSGGLIIAAKFDNLDATGANVGGLNAGEKWPYPLNGYHLENAYLG